MSEPKTLLEAVRHFSDRDVCHAYMVALKWPDGAVKCPSCACDQIGLIQSRRLLQCKNIECRRQFSAKVGTIFEDSPLGLDKWFVATWCVAVGDKISSTALAEALGVEQKTAWRMLVMIRCAKECRMQYAILPGFPAYRVGEDGSIQSRWRKGPGATLGDIWKPMRVRVDQEGYRHVELTATDGTRRHSKIGSLMLRAFVGPPSEGQECRHLDGNEANDLLGNLAWGTPLENHADKRAHGTIARGDRHGKTKLTQPQIDEILSLKGTATQLEVAKRFGVARGYVGQLWSGARKRVPA